MGERTDRRARDGGGRAGGAASGEIAGAVRDERGRKGETERDGGDR